MSYTRADMVPTRREIAKGRVCASFLSICFYLGIFVAGAYTRHRLLHVAWDIFGENDVEYPIDKDTLLGIKPPMPW